MEIAERGGLLHDKFVSFIENLEDIGSNIKRTQKSYDAAFNQLTEGRGNIVGQIKKLKELGAKAQKTYLQIFRRINKKRLSKLLKLEKSDKNIFTYYRPNLSA